MLLPRNPSVQVGSRYGATGAPVMLMQKYIVEPPGNGTDSSTQPCRAATMLLPDSADRSTKHSEDAYVTEPAEAYPQPAFVVAVIGPPRSALEALVGGLAVNVYE